MVHVRNPSEVINVDFQAISDSKEERLRGHKGEKLRTNLKKDYISDILGTKRLDFLVPVTYNEYEVILIFSVQVQDPRGE